MKIDISPKEVADVFLNVGQLKEQVSQLSEAVEFYRQELRTLQNTLELEKQNQADFFANLQDKVGPV